MTQSTMLNTSCIVIIKLICIVNAEILIPGKCYIYLSYAMQHRSTYTHLLHCIYLCWCLFSESSFICIEVSLCYISNQARTWCPMFAYKLHVPRPVAYKIQVQCVQLMAHLPQPIRYRTMRVFGGSKALEISRCK